MAGALVQQATPVTVNTNTTLNISLTGVAVGGMLVLSIGTWNHGSPPGVVSGGGATWTNRLNIGEGTGTNGCEQWEGLNSTGGSVTITWTRAGGNNVDIALALSEYSGMPTSAAYDVAASGPNGGPDTSPDSGLTAATAQADSLALSICANSDANTTMVSRSGDGYTDLSAVTNGAATAVVRPAYKVLSSTGQQQGRFTLGTSTGWDAGVAVYKATAGAASLPPGLGPVVSMQQPQQAALAGWA